MRIPRLWRTTGAATALLVALGTIPSSAVAQLEMAVFGAGEVDTQDLSLLLLGVSVQPAGTGLVPVATLLGYQLSYPVSQDEQRSLTAINPAAGLRYQTAVGAVQAQVGYLFLSRDDAETGGFGAPGGGEEGVTGSVMGDYWGTGFRTAQGIASYNFSDHYLWSRARVAQQVATVAGGPLRVGAELVGQGVDIFGMEEDDPLVGEPYRSVQAGGLVEFQLTPTFRLLGAVGGKSDNVPGNADLFPYFKAEFVLVP